jgi:hypothetical protein
MNPKCANSTKCAVTLVALAFALALVLSPFASVKAKAATEGSEYGQFVQTYVNSDRGNWTSVAKPMFPVNFNESQIGIGCNWSIVQPLLANHSYHVYCYGEWVNNGSTPKTDYDIYVYNPRGILESEHTGAAGLPEQLGTRLGDTFFVPETSGKYTFMIVNDARQSNGTQQATFMVMENIETDQWYTQHIEGKSYDNFSSLTTSWAYEFVTDKTNMEIWIQVPATLDMYEARLYVMSDPQSLTINDAPLPWEPGLYGNVSDKVGGYNLDSENYRGAAYASCESRGQDMLINYSTTSTEKTLYQLVLIGESGSGNVDFLIKTQFGDACLTTSGLLGRIYPSNTTKITYVSNSTDLTDAVLKYSTDHWNSSKTIEMTVSTRNCSAVIPTQRAGTVVEYRVVANDVLMNELVAEGNFTVKQAGILNITAVPEIVYVGENVTIQGVLTGQSSSVPLKVQLMGSLDTNQIECRTMTNGSFSATFQPNATGIWVANAMFAGSNSVFACDSNQVMVTVEEPTFIQKNGVFVGGGFIGAIAIGGVVFFISKRRQ